MCNAFVHLNGRELEDKVADGSFDHLIDELVNLLEII